jgi:hypothetical protein
MRLARDGGGVWCAWVVQRRFPKAQVFVAPGQWSWPLNLPPSFFGIFNSQPLTDEKRGASLPFADEFECEILRPRPIGVNASVKFNEAALFHKPTKTLLVTDAVVHVVCFRVRRFPRAPLASPRQRRCALFSGRKRHSTAWASPAAELAAPVH